MNRIAESQNRAIEFGRWHFTTVSLYYRTTVKTEEGVCPRSGGGAVNVSLVFECERPWRTTRGTEEEIGNRKMAEIGAWMLISGGKGHRASTKLPLGTQSLARNAKIVEGSQARGKKSCKSVVPCTVRCVGTRCDVVIIGWRKTR